MSESPAPYGRTTLDELDELMTSVFSHLQLCLARHDPGKLSELDGVAARYRELIHRLRRQLKEADLRELAKLWPAIPKELRASLMTIARAAAKTGDVVSDGPFAP